MNLFYKIPLIRTRRTREPYIIDTRATISSTDPKVDHTEPPGKSPKLPTYGSYCFRAYTNLVNKDTNTELSDFIGFDDHMDIVDKVTRYCERTRSDDPILQCNPPKLTFIGPSDMCDGRVVVYDKVKDSSHVYF